MPYCEAVIGYKLIGRKQMTAELRTKFKERIDSITKEIESLSNTANQYLKALENIKVAVNELNGEGKALVKLLSELSETKTDDEANKLLKDNESKL